MWHNQTKNSFLLILITAVLFNCSGGKQSKLEKIRVQLVSEGPLYNGPNTAIGIWKPTIESGKKVKSVRFTSVKVSAADTSLSKIAGNLVLQLAASRAEMKKIAFFKGNAATNEVELQLADEQKDLNQFFEGQDITFVIDYDLLPEEWSQNLTFQLEFDAELVTEE